MVALGPVVLVLQEHRVAAPAAVALTPVVIGTAVQVHPVKAIRAVQVLITLLLAMLRQAEAAVKAAAETMRVATPAAVEEQELLAQYRGHLLTMLVVAAAEVGLAATAQVV